MSTISAEMQAYAARFRTFEVPHQLSKRRASSAKKKGANTVEWPHENPTPLALARAGFFYKPTPDSLDNVQCFLCGVKLDGWEADDEPLREHLTHTKSCHWAEATYAGITAQHEGPANAQDPMSEEMLEARRGTFEHRAGWPHEGKRGWKCKIQKMVEGGWCLDPAPATSGAEEEADGVTCFYCDLSLDGWEPKDDPILEHKKRNPACVFFAMGGGIVKKGKAGAKKGARSSTASKASRLSTQSGVSEMPSMVNSLEEDAILAVDDSIASVATVASQATVTGGKKGNRKGGKAKGLAKGAKARKRAGTLDSQQADDEGLYPTLESQSQGVPSSQQDNSLGSVQVQAAEPPKKRGRGRPSKQTVDSSVIEVSSMDVAPKKATRGRKAKAPPEPEPESQAEDVSAQIQEELEHSLDLASEALDQSTPQAVAPAPKPKRGVKRTSDGLIKQQQEESDVSAIAAEFPAPPKPAHVAKAKKGSKSGKKAQAQEQEVSMQQIASTQEDVSMSEAEPPAKVPKGKKGAVKGSKATKTRKASATCASSRTVDTALAQSVHEQPEDLERDEREIEAELERIAAEEITAAQITQGMADVQAEQERAAEYESSPSHQQKHVDAIEHLEHELQVEVAELSRPGENLTTYVQKVAKPSIGSMPGAFSPAPPSEADGTAQQASPAGSDKENVPSSALQQKSARKLSHVQQAPPPVLSPTKTVRIPLAPSTPNKTLLSPSKRALSPSKQPLGPLTSAVPWLPAQLDELLMTSPQPSPNTLATRLADAVGGGALTSPEKGLTVEEWVRWNAGVAEERLRRRCEGSVGVFEGEGVRALGVLGGLDVRG